MTHHYQWKDGSRLKSDPVAAGEFLENLRQLNGGELTAEEVLEAARPVDSPIHWDFEWDNDAAAEAYRLNQARYMIRMLVVVYQDEPEPVRAMVSIREGQQEATYRSVEDVMTDALLYENVRKNAIRDAHAYARKYRHYHFPELANLLDIIDSLMYAEVTQ